MAWIIDRDHEADGVSTDRTGVGRGILSGTTYAFQLRDEAGHVFYSGRFDAAAADNCDDGGDGPSLTAAWEFGMVDVGATDCYVKIGDAITVGLWTRELAARDGSPDSQWISVFG